jgi:hypothetical protein
MFGGARKATLKRAAGQVLDSEIGDTIASLVAKQEQALLEELQRTQQAVGIEDPVDVPDVDERKEQLTDAVDGLMGGDVPGVWMDHVGRHYLDDPDLARERFLDLDADEWGRQCDKIVKSYRQQGVTDLPRSEVIEHYIGSRFGVDVRTFVVEVVNWPDARKQATARQLLLGNYEAVEEGLRDIRAVAEGGDADG